MTLDNATREVLECRSVRDKIVIPRHQAICPVSHLPIVSRLVREGYLVWFDRAVLPMGIMNTATHELVTRQISCDIYLLTPNGVALCEEHGIPQR